MSSQHASVKERIRRILTVAAAQGHTHLVLGAFGCGVFGNDPVMIADTFMDELTRCAPLLLYLAPFSVRDACTGAPPRLSECVP